MYMYLVVVKNIINKICGNIRIRYDSYKNTILYHD